jgi:hypothetical protein
MYDPTLGVASFVVLMRTVAPCEYQKDIAKAQRVHLN